MIARTRQALRGRKTNIMASIMFVYALAAVLNGWGDAEVSAGIGAMGAAFAALRAGVNKNNGGSTARLIVVCVLCMFLLGGCAALGTVDPETGTSPAQDIVAAIASGASLFGPAVGTAVPTAAAAILMAIIAFGKVDDGTSTPTPPGQPE